MEPNKRKYTKKKPADTWTQLMQQAYANLQEAQTELKKLLNLGHTRICNACPISKTCPFFVKDAIKGDTQSCVKIPRGTNADGQFFTWRYTDVNERIAELNLN